MSAIVVIEVLLVVALQLKHVIDPPWWWLPAQPSLAGRKISKT